MMLKDIARGLILPFIVVFSPLSFSAQALTAISFNSTKTMLEHYGAGFASLEHKALGDSFPLKGLDSSKRVLTLPNGIQLSYGEIMMYAGDLFGVPHHPVSNCEPGNVLNCFNEQFAALAIHGDKKKYACTNPIRIMNKLKPYMAEQEKRLNEFRQQGLPDSAYYKQSHDEDSKTLNKLTCGGSLISAYIPLGVYLQLSEMNFDHFAPDAITTYKAGHQLALQTALDAHKLNALGRAKKAQKQLELAYAQNAFANHFLTDASAAGHMRTPRRAIAENVDLIPILQLVLANLMHDEDGRLGLHVVNNKGQHWVAYGDGFLYDPQAQRQREILLEAMQLSADSIYDTYIKGILPPYFEELDLLPDYSKISKLNQTNPLFKFEHGVLLKRVQSFNPYDSDYTSIWSGLLTLIEFQIEWS